MFLVWIQYICWNICVSKYTNSVSLFSLSNKLNTLFFFLFCLFSMFFLDSNKNRLAVDVINKLIAHCCWMNIHTVPPHGVVFEIRVADGYGARWSEDGCKVCGYTKLWYLLYLINLFIVCSNFSIGCSIELSFDSSYYIMLRIKLLTWRKVLYFQLAIYMHIF